jgi:hypothetical protein
VLGEEAGMFSTRFGGSALETRLRNVDEFAIYGWSVMEFSAGVCESEWERTHWSAHIVSRGHHAGGGSPLGPPEDYGVDRRSRCHIVLGRNREGGGNCPMAEEGGQHNDCATPALL